MGANTITPPARIPPAASSSRPCPEWRHDQRRPDTDRPAPSGDAALIRQRIPGVEVRLYSCGEAFGYGSRARGTAGPKSDIDLLITAADAWLGAATGAVR
ncbi:nucleotidyltransferase domain-containing protein [Cyanobium sp. FGCU-52]|nr:nucleotidyltransferase domain-containing protein [Cyanobium sp. FGCU52]